MWEFILITRAVSLNPPESEFVYFVANGFLVVGNVDGGAGGRRAHLGLEPWVKTRARYEVKSIDPLRRQGRRSQLWCLSSTIPTHLAEPGRTWSGSTPVCTRL